MPHDLLYANTGTAVDTARALAVARLLVSHGAHLMLFQPAMELDETGARAWNPRGGTGNTGYLFYSDWQHTPHDPDVVDRWLAAPEPKPALAMICGHGFDAVDNDPRNGGDDVYARLADAMPPVLAIQDTPSSGQHHIIAALGIRKTALAGVDIQAGLATCNRAKPRCNGGHGFVFLAPTVKWSKTLEAVSTYVWRPDVSGLLDPDFGAFDAQEAFRDRIVTIAIEQTSARRAANPATADPSGKPSRHTGDRDPDATRMFNDREADAYIQTQVVERLRSAPQGTVANTLFVAGTQLGHFVPTHLTEDAAVQLLVDTLGSCVGNDGTKSWDEMHEIENGLRVGQGEWVAMLVDGNNPFGGRPYDDIPMRLATPSGSSWLTPSYVTIPAPTTDSERFRTGRVCDATGAVANEPLSNLFADPAFPMFGHVRQFARARGVSPVAVLGVVLTRVSAALPTYVVTPPLIGGHGSLNAFLCLVGQAGMSKGGATKAAEAAVAISMDHCANGVFQYAGPVYSPKIGSGQGVAAQFCHRRKPDAKTGDPGELIRDRDSVLFTCQEVTDLTAKASGASTLLSTVCEMWVAEPLGSSYVDPTKRLPVAGMSYRACFVLHAQPDLLGPLLIDAAPTGAPQRFLYLPVADAFRPDDRPAEPAPVKWSPPVSSRLGGDNQHVVPVCEEAQWAILDHNGRMHEGLADPLDGHVLFATLKTAVAISATRGRLDVDLASWKHAVALHDLSRRTRTEVIEHLREQKRVAHREVAKAEGHKDVIKAEVIQAVEVDKSRVRIIAVLASAPVYTLTKRDIQKRCSRKWDGEAFDLLCTDGSVLWKTVPTGAARGIQEVTVYALAQNS